MIVDAHVHILPDRVRDNLKKIAAAEPWFAACHAKGEAVASAESLVEAMDRNEIERSICFTWPFASPELCREGNDYLAQAQERFPGRIIGFGVVQPSDRDAATEVKRCAELGLRGLGELNADAQGWSWDGDGIATVVKAAQRVDFPINVHCSEPIGADYPGRGTATPDVLVFFAKRFPKAKLIASHLGGGLPFYSQLPEVREVCERIWLDTAAMPFLYGPYAYRAAIDACGASRILFGSDHPQLDLPRYRYTMSGADVSRSEMNSILGGNAAALLGL